MDKLKSYDSIIISPHFDDAILSLYGYIHRFKETEKILVLNVFSGRPDSRIKLSPLAKNTIMHDLNINDVISIDPILYNQRRNAEDQKAIDHLGVKRHDLNYLDAIFRGNPPLYTNERELFSNIKESDIKIIVELFQIIKHNFVKGCKLFFPLAIGEHVDHQIVNFVGKQLAKENYNCIFYEDFPYCAIEDIKYVNDKGFNSHYEAFYVDLEGIIDKKVSAIKIYDSQIKGLFGDKSNIINMLNKYFESSPSQTINGFERIWLKKDNYSVISKY
ncbi:MULTISPECIES: PIG-L deacetylase family protein [Heyndrickxia]|uniref:PIG-L deacetylase family protein n=1 Tax=Heyndrickxia TaxID=2837504 RepID=UPI0030F8110F